MIHKAKQFMLTKKIQEKSTYFRKTVQKMCKYVLHAIIYFFLKNMIKLQ